MSLELKITKKLKNFAMDTELTALPGISVCFGLSGSGKSMTLKIISGLEKPDNGYIKFDGKAIFDSANKINIPAQKRGVGYVFQNHSLFPHMTVRQNILYGGKGMDRTEAAERCENLMQVLNISEQAGKYPDKISGGQQQRAAIARAILRNPKILLLDEPFSALDAITKKKMIECLTTFLKRLEIPVLLVTHDILEASILADRMFVFSNGRIIQSGTFTEIAKKPVNDEIRELLTVPSLN